jgi:hypothetical protein
MSADGRAATQCDALVERLLQVEFKPEQRGRKIAHSCAVYLSRRPRDVTRRPL